MINDSLELLSNGSIIPATTTMYTDTIGAFWPIIPYLGILFSIRFATKSDAITAFASVLGVLAMASTDYFTLIQMNGAVYAIAVLTTAMLIYRSIWGK